MCSSTRNRKSRSVACIRIVFFSLSYLSMQIGSLPFVDMPVSSNRKHFVVPSAVVSRLLQLPLPLQYRLQRSILKTNKSTRNPDHATTNCENDTETQFLALFSLLSSKCLLIELIFRDISFSPVKPAFS